MLFQSKETTRRRGVRTPSVFRSRRLAKNLFFVLLSVLSVLSAVAAGTANTDGGEQTSLTVGIVTVILLIIAATIVIIALLPMKKHPDPPRPGGDTPGMGNNGKGYKNTVPSGSGNTGEENGKE